VFLPIVISALLDIVLGMKRDCSNSWLVGYILLVLMLAIAQTGAVAHAYGHDAEIPQDQTCVSCVNAGQLVFACVGDALDLDIRNHVSDFSTDKFLSFESTHTLAAKQRGPPDPL